MTRPIKFRAWWKHPKYMPEGKMYFVGGIFFAKQQEGEPEYDMPFLEVGLMERETNSKIGWNDGNECILMQFTGLKDKNGKEIYEGDCLGGIWEYGYIGYCDKCKGFQFIMPLTDGCAACSGDIFWYEVVEDDGKLEIIGNIYENPNLLNQ